MLENELWSPGDSAMVDHSFTIESDLKEFNVDLGIYLLSLVGEHS